MTQITGVYEFVLGFLGCVQRKSEKFEHKGARSQAILGGDGEVEEENEHEERNGE